MGWSGSHESPPKVQTKQAVELCDVPARAFSRYYTPIGYDEKEVGVIRHTHRGWCLTISGHDLGAFKTYLGASKAAVLYFAGLDIVPLDANGNPEVWPQEPQSPT
ncbi:MAG: hypothetical protein IJI03_12395 [Rudaea sp.]|nr:hypothetical protein [Rudaea sp.]